MPFGSFKSRNEKQNQIKKLSCEMFGGVRSFGDFLGGGLRGRSEGIQ
jgi:hypothetical protein